LSIVILHFYFALALITNAHLF